MNKLHPQSDAGETAEFEARTRAALLASAENLDGHTRSKLTQARYAALEAAKRKPKFWQTAPGRWLVPASGATAAAVLAVVLSFNPARFESDAHHGATVFEDLEIVASDDSLELYQDMDFYTWLNSENSDDWMPSEARDEDDSKAVS